jgi:hypothetical protein
MYSSCYCYGPSYCPGHLTNEEVEAVGFRYGDVGLMLCRYDVRSSKSMRRLEPRG